MSRTLNFSTRRFSRRKAALACAAILAVGFGGVLATGAYFTDQQTMTANTLKAGTVLLGDVGDSSNTALSFSNVLPIASSDVATKATVFPINIRNIGTAAIDWSAAIQLPANASTDASNLAGNVQISYSTDNGATYSTPVSLAAFAAAGPVNSTSSVPAGSSSASSTKLLVRAWLPATTTNASQGKSLSFDLVVRAIQAGAPSGEIAKDSNYAVLNR